MDQRAVECECGNNLPVPQDASSSLKCACGTFVILPPAEEFEGKRVVLSASTIERRIRRLIYAGELPPSSECAWCGSLHAKPVDIRLVCETSTSWQTGGERLVIIPLGIGVAWSYSNQEERVETVGRDNTVPVPLCACETCARNLRAPEPLKIPRFLVSLALVVIAAAVAGFSPLLGLAVAVLPLVLLFVVLPWRHRLRARRWGQALKDKIRQVPIYAQLLREYRYATVTVAPWIWLPLQ